MLLKEHPNLAFIAPVAKDIIQDACTLGGCGLIQAATFEALCNTYGQPKKAYLVTSLGSDARQTSVTYQGTRITDISALLESFRHIRPIIHYSPEETTSFRVKKTRGEMEYEPVGRSIHDLENPANVDSLLKRLYSEGFPGIIIISGIPPRAADLFIEKVQNFRDPPPYIMIDPGKNTIREFRQQKGPDLYPNLWKVDLVRVNDDEKRLLFNNYGEPEEWMNQYRVNTVVATRRDGVSIFNRERSISNKGLTEIFREIIRNNQHPVREDTLGVGDVLMGAVGWRCSSETDIKFPIIRDAFKKGVAVAHNFMTQKDGRRGFTSFTPNLNEIEESPITVKRISIEPGLLSSDMRLSHWGSRELTRLYSIRQWSPPHTIFRAINGANVDYTRGHHTLDAIELFFPTYKKTPTTEMQYVVMGILIHDAPTSGGNPHADIDIDPREILRDKTLGQGEFVNSGIPEYLKHHGLSPTEMVTHMEDNTYIAKIIQAFENLSHILADSLKPLSKEDILKLAESIRLNKDGSISIPYNVRLGGENAYKYLERNSQNVLNAYHEQNWKAVFYRSILMQLQERTLREQNIPRAYLYQIGNLEYVAMLSRGDLSRVERDALWVFENGALPSDESQLPDLVFYDIHRIDSEIDEPSEAYIRFKEGTDTFFKNPRAKMPEEDIELVPVPLRLKGENIRVGKKVFNPVEELSLGICIKQGSKLTRDEALTILSRDIHFGPHLELIEKRKRDGSNI